MKCLPSSQANAIFLDSKKLYAALAEYPITKGHVVVVWKKHVKDLGKLKEKDYDYLMGVVDEVRNAMMKVLGVKKVYLIYMDEANHVHWHLVPRYDEEGFNMLTHKPGRLKDVSLAKELKKKIN
ncbi:HIT domain-containing protein [Patescibacteria group bacterium]|nr:HIT domain-containing protein [Patescibacteria group bacterium]